MITKDFCCRVFEVSNNGEIVWKYAPATPEKRNKINAVYYRAYRIPPEWTKNNPSEYAFWEYNLK